MGGDRANEIWERRKLGIDLRQKYELYFVTLSFTLAGLAVQTATPSASKLDSGIEIAGWVFLILAGLLGLWRLRRLWLREVAVADYQDRQNADNDVEFKNEIEHLERVIRKREGVQLALFVLGISAVALSRSAKLLYLAASCAGAA